MSKIPTYEELEQRIRELEQAEAECKRMGEALRLERDNLHNIFESMEDGIYIVNQQYDIQYVNSVLVKDFGPYEGVKCYKYFHDLDKVCPWCKNQDVWAGKTVRWEWYSSKNERTYDLIDTPMTLSDGSIGKLEIFRDIHDRKRAEDALRESEEKYRSLTNDVLDSSAIGVFLLDSDFRVVWVNQALERYFGLRRDEVVGKDKRQLIRERIADIFQDPEIFTEKVFNTYDDNTYIENFECHVLANGEREERWLEHWSQPIRTGLYAGGRVEHYSDITKQKQTETILQESEEKYRFLLENAGEAIFIAQDETLKFCNPATERLTGYSKEELSSISFVKFIHPEDREMVLERYQKRLRNEKVETGYSFRFIDRNGMGHWVYITSTITSWEGKPATLNFVNDISSQKNMEAQLRQAQKMEAVGTLAGGVAHDFNNLLTTIIGNAELALMQIYKGDPLNEYIEEIKNAGNTAASLTRQLLTFSRKQMIQPKVLSINRILHDMEKMLRRLIREDIEMVLDLDSELWPVNIDPGQIEQVSMNLVVNAGDAMPKGGKLLIETANVHLDRTYFRNHGVENTSGAYVMLALTDNGTGMDEKTRDRIFEPFFTTKEMGQGTGLGLSTVYGIMKQNNGYVWVYSEPGKGTTFKVYFPKAGADEVSDTEEQVGDDLLIGSETILVVEDSKTLLKITQKMLEKYGYRILTAQNGREALEVFSGHDGPIHLILTDVVMPKMGGQDLVEKIQSEKPEVKLVYMSGYTDRAISDNGMLHKDVNFIQKPFSSNDLVRKVREVLNK
ncbi:MAG: hypothetical protein DRH24_17790 [Deltaproteobacteria bacterium]|nr:MAG: hypothetical protein DRH24_17790 [Deltaproteobacteria bacterium]